MSSPTSAPLCSQCGSPAAIGLAACPYCNVRYPGVPAGVACPGCSRLNASRRTECASCRCDMTRACAACAARSPLDLVSCFHCHRLFHDHGGVPGQRPGATTAHDPCHVFGALDDILDS